MYLAIGLPLLGWTPPARGIMSRRREPECSVAEFLDGRTEGNSNLIQRLISSGDKEVDSAAFQKTLEEVKASVLEGPYPS